MRYSVSVIAEGDREIRLDGIASGAGSMSYGAQIVVEATDSDAAVDAAVPLFIEAARSAGLPEWPVTRAETISEVDDLEAFEP